MTLTAALDDVSYSCRQLSLTIAQANEGLHQLVAVPHRSLGCCSETFDCRSGDGGVFDGDDFVEGGDAREVEDVGGEVEESLDECELSGTVVPGTPEARDGRSSSRGGVERRERWRGEVGGGWERERRG